MQIERPASPVAFFDSHGIISIRSRKKFQEVIAMGGFYTDKDYSRAQDVANAIIRISNESRIEKESIDAGASRSAKIRRLVLAFEKAAIARAGGTGTDIEYRDKRRKLIAFMEGKE